jgi:hypothetical protein
LRGGARAYPGAEDVVLEETTALALARGYGSSSCIEDTPTSITTPSTAATPSTLYRLVSGRENVKCVMEAASKIYENLKFTEQAADGRQYVEWKAHAFESKSLSGITVITRNAAGAITHLAIHHKPLGEALKFSAEIGQRLQGAIDASYFLQAEDPSRGE